MACVHVQRPLRQVLRTESAKGAWRGRGGGASPPAPAQREPGGRRRADGPPAAGEAPPRAAPRLARGTLQRSTRGGGGQATHQVLQSTLTSSPGEYR